MLKSLVNIFFPKVCYACFSYLGDNEDAICTHCRHNLPITNFHFENNDAIKKVFYGRAKIEHGTALFRFEKKGLVQQLIHGLKYKGYEKVGIVLGNWLGRELKTINTYKTIDMVVPVPLHRNKLKKRGYNQVTKFGQQLALSLNIEFNDRVLIKTTPTQSQVTKKRLARWNNDEASFTIKDTSSIENKHILLVDDIITTCLLYTSDAPTTSRV